MDCCFNLYIPKSQRDMIVIRPSGKTFINGLAESYSLSNYNKEYIGKAMTQAEYEKVIDHFNSALFNDYPCPGCQFIGYCCCPCTLGLSFIFPLYQVNKARKSLESQIERMNTVYENKQLKYTLRVEKSTSYILLYLPNHPMWQTEKKQENGQEQPQQQPKDGNK